MIACCSGQDPNKPLSILDICKENSPAPFSGVVAMDGAVSELIWNRTSRTLHIYSIYSQRSGSSYDDVHMDIYLRESGLSLEFPWEVTRMPKAVNDSGQLFKTAVLALNAAVKAALAGFPEDFNQKAGADAKD